MSRIFEFPLDKKSESEKIKLWQNEFLSQKTADRQHSNRVRLLNNFGCYSGVDFKQWDWVSVQTLTGQGRPAHTINITQNIVDTIQGQLEQTPLDVNYKPTPIVGMEKTDQTNIAQYIYDADKERGDYEFEWLKYERDRLIHTGVLKVYLDQRHNHMGNVGLIARNPTHIWPDAFWQSDDIRDCRVVFDVNWMTAPDIENTFKSKIDEIVRAVERAENPTLETQALDKGADTSVEFFDQLNERYKVIEAVWMERLEINSVEKDGKVIKKFLGQLQDGELQDLVTHQPQTFKLKKQEKSVCRQFTFVPGLSTEFALVDDAYPIQMGMLPYIIGSFKNIYGERQGVPDLTNDLQSMLNKQDSAITHWQATAANNNVFVEEDTFSDGPAGLERYNRLKTKGGGVFSVVAGANREEKVKIEPRQSVPPDMTQRSDAIFNRAYDLVGITAAAQGRAERANESSILFNSKAQQSLVILESQGKFRERDRQVWAEMYFIALKQVYSEGFRLLSKNSGDVLEINKLVATGEFEGETGQPIFDVFNDIKNLGRHNVFITTSRTGKTRKGELLLQSIEISKVTTGPLQLTVLEEARIDLMDLPEELKEKMKEGAAKELELKIAQIDAQIAQLTASTAQFQAQAQQQGGGPGGGAPPGGQQLPPGQEGGPQGPREINRNPGFGNIPEVSGIQGGQGANNNASTGSAPSDLAPR